MPGPLMTTDGQNRTVADGLYAIAGALRDLADAVRALRRELPGRTSPKPTQKEARK